MTDGTTREILPKAEAPECLAVSPAGRTLAYLRGTDFESGLAPKVAIRLMDLQSGETRTLLEFPLHWDGLLTDVLWTADGQAIIFGVAERTYNELEYRTQLEQIDITDGRRRKIGQPLDLRAESFTYSPDGELLVVCWQPLGDKNKRNELWSIDLPTGARKSMNGMNPNPFLVDWFAFAPGKGAGEIAPGGNPLGRTAADPQKAPEPRRAGPHSKIDRAKRLNQQGNDLAQVQNWAEAESKYRQASQLDSSNAEYLSSLGVSLVRQGKWPAAELALREAVQRAPDNPTFRGNLAHVLRGQNKPAEAETQFREAIRHAPSMAVLHNDLGVLLESQQRLQDAERSYRTAVKLAPENGQFHANMAGVLYLMGRIDEAARTAQKATRLGHDKHWVYEKLR